MRAVRATRGRRDGFLMVEALAALALGALILIGLLSLSGLLRRSADRAAWDVEVSEVSSRTVGTIARELRQAQRRRWAVPPPPVGPRRTGGQGAAAASQAAAARAQQATAAGAARPQQADAQGQGQGQGQEPDAPPRPFVFSGAPDRVAFALTPRQDSGLRAPVLVAWQIDEAGATLRAEAPLRLDAMGPAGVEFGPVARIDPGPERIRFAYVERQPNGAESVLDAWADPLKMPAAVRIDRFDAATGRQVGSLRVPLLIDAEPGCAAEKGQCSRVDGAAAASARPGQSPTSGDAAAQADPR